MKKIFAPIAILSALLFCNNSNGQAVQDFTHGVYVENAAFAANPGNWSGKIVELRNIPFAGSKPTPAPVKSRTATANSSNPTNNTNSPNLNAPIAPANAGPSGGTATSTVTTCESVAGYNSMPFAITPTFKPCILMTNAVKKQLPTKSSKVILYVYCKSDGSLELKRIKRIN
ncbi:MAG: hypothetical protein ACK448_03135 [Bacteroidota bacterium]|jgi:hypothetical protein